MKTVSAIYREKGCQIVGNLISFPGGRFLSIFRWHSTLFLLLSLLQSLPNVTYFFTRCLRSVFLSPFISVPFFCSSYTLYSTTYTPQQHVETNWDSVIAFFIIPRCKEGRARFPSGKYNVLDVSLWIQDSPNDDAKEIFVVMHYRASRRQFPVVLPGFHCTADTVVQEFGAHQIREVLREAMAASS